MSGVLSNNFEIGREIRGKKKLHFILKLKPKLFLKQNDSEKTVVCCNWVDSSDGRTIEWPTEEEIEQQVEDDDGAESQRR